MPSNNKTIFRNPSSAQKSQEASARSSACPPTLLSVPMRNSKRMPPAPFLSSSPAQCGWSPLPLGLDHAVSQVAEGAFSLLPSLPNRQVAPVLSLRPQLFITNGFMVILLYCVLTFNSWTWTYYTYTDVKAEGPSDVTLDAETVSNLVTPNWSPPLSAKAAAGLETSTCRTDSWHASGL